MNMECNREEALRASELAEQRFKANDLHGAKRLALKAQRLWPSLSFLSQTIAAYDVHIAFNNNKSLPNWRAVLGVDPVAGLDEIKKQYRRMCLLTHPDKNRSAAAEGACKIVMQAWSALSNPSPYASMVAAHQTPPAKPQAQAVTQWEHLRALISCGRCAADFVWAFKRSKCTQNLFHYCKKCSNWTLIEREPVTSRATLICTCGANLRWGPYRPVRCECKNCKNQCDVAVDLNWMSSDSGKAAGSQSSSPQSAKLACPNCGAWSKYSVEDGKYRMKCGTCGSEYVVEIESGDSAVAGCVLAQSSTLACPYCGTWDNFLVLNSKYFVDCKRCGTRTTTAQIETGFSGQCSRAQKRKCC